MNDILIAFILLFPISTYANCNLSVSLNENFRSFTNEAGISKVLKITQKIIEKKGYHLTNNDDAEFKLNLELGRLLDMSNGLCQDAETAKSTLKNNSSGKDVFKSPDIFYCNLFDHRFNKPIKRALKELPECK